MVSQCIGIQRRTNLLEYGIVSQLEGYHRFVLSTNDDWISHGVTYYLASNCLTNCSPESSKTETGILCLCFSWSFNHCERKVCRGTHPFGALTTAWWSGIFQTLWIGTKCFGRAPPLQIERTVVLRPTHRLLYKFIPFGNTFWLWYSHTHITKIIKTVGNPCLILWTSNKRKVCQSSHFPASEI